MRTLISDPPFPDDDPQVSDQAPWTERRAWPADWVAPPQALRLPVVICYRCRITLQSARRVRIHVSADERYRLTFDGRILGAGPERCSPERWSFETYDLDLTAGPHELRALVWSLGPSAPWPQTSIRHGFLCAAQDPADRPLLTTGQAGWTCRQERAWSTLETPAELGRGGGCGFSFDAGRPPGPWQAVRVVANATGPGVTYVGRPRHLLRPAMLPAPEERPIAGARARHADAAAQSAGRIDADVNDAAVVAAWQRLLDGREALHIPAGTTQRVVIDLGVYHCHRPRCRAVGRGGCIDLVYAEAGMRSADQAPLGKDRRDVVTGACLVGLRDEFHTGEHVQRFTPLWWRAGRYVLVHAHAGEAELVIDRCQFIATAYPLRISAAWTADAQATLWEACVRTLRCCLHETYMDCPYHEQLQYVADVRIQALCGYVLSDDVRPQQAALHHFDASRCNQLGLVTSSHPNPGGQIIPTFSLQAIGMLHDHLLWRGNAESLRPLLMGMRSTLERFLAARDAQGFPRSLPGWNFIDAEGEDMPYGIPPGGQSGGRSTAIAWMLVTALDQAAILETACGALEYARRWRRAAATVATVLLRDCWDAVRGCFRAAPDDDRDLLHVQVLAGLCPRLPAGIRDHLAASCLTRAAEASYGIMFSHHLFELATITGRFGCVRPLWRRWQACLEQGFSTFPEHWERTRSDCHAWSAHPIYHFIVGVVGLRPDAVGFARLRLAPQLDPGEAVQVVVPHPQGRILVDLHHDSAGLQGRIVAPVVGRLHWQGRSRRLRAGDQRIHLVDQSAWAGPS